MKARFRKVPVQSPSSLVSEAPTTFFPIQDSMVPNSLAPCQYTSSSKDLGITFRCKSCLLEKPLAQMCKSRQGVCKDDSSAYKCLTDRWNKHQALKIWWNEKTVEDKAAWYRKQQQLPQGNKRRFDEVTYEEGSKSSKGQDEAEQDLFQPWSEFLKDQTLSGKTTPEAEALWLKAMQDPNTECIKRRNQWLVPKFVGVLRAKIESQRAEQENKRKKNPETVEQLQMLNEQGKKLANQFLDSCQGAKIGYMDAYAPVCDTTEAEQPAQPPPLDIMCAQAQREIMQRVREETTRATAAAEDLMQSAVHEGKTTIRASASKSLNLPMMRVTALNKVETVKAKIDCAKKDADQQCKETIKMCTEEAGRSADEAVARNITEMIRDLGTAKEKGMAYLASLDVKLQNLRGSIETASSAEALTLMLKDVNAIFPTITKSDAGVMKRKISSVNTFIIQAQRKSSSAAAAAAGPQRRGCEELVAKLMEVYEECRETRGAGTSVFEAKCGQRAAFVVPSVDVVSKLTNMPPFKKAMKLLTSHLDSTQWGVAPLPDTAAKKTTKELQKGLDAMCFTKLPLPDAEWSKKLYRYEVFGKLRDFSVPNLPHFCAMEVRLLTSGIEMVLGFNFSTTPGRDLKEKRLYLTNATKEELVQIINTDGWVARCDTTKALVVPSGFIMHAFTLDDKSCGLRWSIASDDNDTARVAHMCAATIKSYPEMGAPTAGLTQFITFWSSD